MPLPALKVDQKSLGPVQVMIGAVMFMFGIVNKDLEGAAVPSGVMFWGSVSFFCSGAASAATVDHRHSFLVKSSLILNLISTVAAFVAAVVLIVDLVAMSKILQLCTNSPNHDCLYTSPIVIYVGRTYRALLVLSIFEVCMSIWTFVLVWRSRDSTEATS